MTEISKDSIKNAIADLKGAWGELFDVGDMGNEADNDKIERLKDEVESIYNQLEKLLAT